MAEESNGTVTKEEQRLQGRFISARRLQTMLDVKGLALARDDNKTKIRDAKFDMLEYVQQWLYREVSMMESLEMGMAW